MSKELQKAHHDLQTAKRLLTSYYDTRFSLGDTVPPQLTPSKSPEATFFGGILNNRNDPSKRKALKRTNPLLKHHSPSASLQFREVSCLDLDFLPLFTRNSSYRIEKKLGLTGKTHTNKHKSASELQTTDEQFISTAGIRLKPRLTKVTTKPRTARNPRPLLISTAVDTEGSKDQYQLTTTSISTASLCLSPVVRRQNSPASQYLDRVVRGQAFKRYFPKENGAKRVVRMRSPHASYRPPTQPDWQALAIRGASTRK